MQPCSDTLVTIIHCSPLRHGHYHDHLQVVIIIIIMECSWVLLLTCSVPSGVRRSAPLTRMAVPVDVRALRPPTSAATCELTYTCIPEGQHGLGSMHAHC